MHCSDLHLGSRFEGISTVDGVLGKRMTESVFTSFDRIVNVARAEKADFMVISGDIFDDKYETPATRHRFATMLEKLEMPCFICLGNHDPVQSWTESIPYPKNVHVFGKEPESIMLDIRGSNVEIIGRSFPDIHSKEDPTKGIRGKDGVFSIAVLHGDADGVNGGDYAPFKLADTRNKGIDYWALGHIHLRSVLSDNPYAVYPGNIQGRNRKESGEKGAYLVTVNGNKVSELKFIATQAIVWAEEKFDITGKTLEMLLREIESKVGKDRMVRVILEGNGDLDAPLRISAEEMMKDLGKASGSKVSSIVLATHPYIDRNKLAEGKDFKAVLIKTSDNMSQMSKEELIEKICSTGKTFAKVKYMLEWLSEEELRAMVFSAEALVLNKMTEASK